MAAIIAGVTGLNGYDIAHLAKLFHALEDNVHLSCFPFPP